MKTIGGRRRPSESSSIVSRRFDCRKGPVCGESAAGAAPRPACWQFPASVRTCSVMVKASPRQVNVPSARTNKHIRRGGRIGRSESDEIDPRDRGAGASVPGDQEKDQHQENHVDQGHRVFGLPLTSALVQSALSLLPLRPWPASRALRISAITATKSCELAFAPTITRRCPAPACFSSARPSPIDRQRPGYAVELEFTFANRQDHIGLRLPDWFAAAPAREADLGIAGEGRWTA